MTSEGWAKPLVICELAFIFQEEFYMNFVLVFTTMNAKCKAITNHFGAWWLSGKFGAFRPCRQTDGLMFESHSIAAT